MDDLVDQAGARLAVGPVEAGVAGRPPLADHVARSRLERGLDHRHPAVRRKQRRGVLLADLAEHRESVREGPDQVDLLLLGHLHGPARHLDVPDPELLEPGAKLGDAPAQPRELRQCAAQHHRNTRRPVAIEFVLQVLRHVRRAPAEPHEVDVLPRGAREPRGGLGAEPDVDYVRETDGPRLRRPVR